MENNSKISTIVYLTLNIKNSKIYVGVHDVDANYPKFDGYLGNMVNIYKPSSIQHPKEPFQYAVKEYGFDAFRRITLFECQTREEALMWEGIIVNEDFLKRPDVYNITLGGGAPKIYKKPIYQYDLTGNFLEAFDSVKSASEKFKVSASSISHAVIFKSISCESYWTNYQVDKIDPSQFLTTKQAKNVYFYNLNGDFIKEYPSMMEAARQNNTSLDKIQRAIYGQYKFQDTYYLSLEKVDSFKPKIYTRKKNVPVHQYSLAGEYIKTYNSVGDAVRELGNKFTHITSSIKQQKTCGGYQWSWEKLDKLPNKEKNIHLGRKIAQYTLSGEFVKEWRTIRECKKEFGNVNKVLAGRAKQTKGYIFKYID